MAIRTIPGVGKVDTSWNTKKAAGPKKRKAPRKRSHGTLTDYKTGASLRPATAAEAKASKAAARRDGGAGVIAVDGRSCFVS
jgi:hypothetical protein